MFVGCTKPHHSLCTKPVASAWYKTRGCRGWGGTFSTSSYMVYTTST